MKEFPVNSVCIIVDANEKFKHFVGRECTITEPLKLYSDIKEEEYRIHVQGEIKDYRITHKCLKLKKLPPDEAFDKFLNNLKQPVEELV